MERNPFIVRCPICASPLIEVRPLTPECGTEFERGRVEHIEKDRHSITLMIEVAP